MNFHSDHDVKYGLIHTILLSKYASRVDTGKTAHTSQSRSCLLNTRADAGQNPSQERVYFSTGQVACTCWVRRTAPERRPHDLGGRALAPVSTPRRPHFWDFKFKPPGHHNLGHQSFACPLIVVGRWQGSSCNNSCRGMPSYLDVRQGG